MAKKDNGITQYFGDNLAKILSDKITTVYKQFDSNEYISAIKKQQTGKSYTQRIELHAIELKKFLPQDFKKSCEIFIKILGAENPNETGMFKEFYWVMPLGKFVEKYGLDNFDISIRTIEEITKRNTGEYAIKPFIRANPKKTLSIMKKWAQSENFHLRRLASEGLRPKLPWSTKLSTFIDNPSPVFEILDILKEDEVKFVQKSVANHLTDYLKVNTAPTAVLLKKWQKSHNKNTQWIIKHATRKFDVI